MVWLNSRKLWFVAKARILLAQSLFSVCCQISMSFDNALETAVTLTMYIQQTCPLVCCKYANPIGSIFIFCLLLDIERYFGISSEFPQKVNLILQTTQKSSLFSDYIHSYQLNYSTPFSARELPVLLTSCSLVSQVIFKLRLAFLSKRDLYVKIRAICISTEFFHTKGRICTML